MRREPLNAHQITALGNAVSFIFGAISNVEEDGQNRFSIPQEVINDFYGWALDPDNYSAQTDDLLQFIVPNNVLSTLAGSSGIDTRQEGDPGFDLNRNIMLYDHDVRNAYAYIFENATNETKARLPENFMDILLQSKNGLNRSAMPQVLMNPDDERAPFAQNASTAQRALDRIVNPNNIDASYSDKKPNPKREIKNAKAKEFFTNVRGFGRSDNGQPE
jgi:hypothetical protein